MQWIFVFIAGIGPVADANRSLGNYASTPTVIARYASEEKCQAGLDMFAKSIAKQTGALAGRGNYLCLPVGMPSTD